MFAWVDSRPPIQKMLSFMNGGAVPQELPIYDMAERHFGLTDAVAENYVEAARVCIDQHHESPVTFQVKGKRRTTSAVVKWDPPDDRTKAA